MKNPFNSKPWERDPIWQRDNYTASAPEVVRIWKNTQALRAMLADVQREALSKLSALSVPPGTPDTLPNRISELRFGLIRSASELAAAESLLRAAEASEEFARAEKEFAPLVKAAEAKLAKEEEDRLAKQTAEAEVARARAEAERRAIENADSDPAVIRAKEKLAALTPA
jgi:hypothetical protein